LSSVLLLELLKTLQLFLSAAIDAEPAFTRRTHEQIQRPVASGYITNMVFLRILNIRPGAILAFV
jgi:hypothetical protein